MKINVACGQIQPKFGDRAANIGRIIQRIEEAKDLNPHVQLVVFPELATTGYECGNEFLKLAERLTDGESVQWIAAAAAKYKVHVAFGFPQRDEHVEDAVYNAAVLLSATGEIIGTYHKTHLFDKEKQVFRPGNKLPVFETAIGKIAMAIGWDMAFPELARCYAINGANLLAVVNGWEDPYAEDWDIIVKARAFDNILPVAAANRVGKDITMDFFGHSSIHNHLGRPLAQLNERIEGVISATIDYDAVQKDREGYYTFLQDRRPEVYAGLLKL